MIFVKSIDKLDKNHAPLVTDGAESQGFPGNPFIALHRIFSRQGSSRINGRCAEKSAAEGQVIENLMRAAQGRFGTDNPLRFTAAFDHIFEFLCIVQFPERCVKPQLSGGVGFIEVVQEKTSKKARKDA